MNTEAKYRETLARAYSALKKAENRIRELEGVNREPVAIIGMSCRFPKAANPDQLWRQLEQGYDAVERFPAERWNTDSFFDEDWQKPGKYYVRDGAFLREIDQFDPLFFNISPAEAREMDPQQRLLLELVWESIECAAIPASSLKGSRTGVFMAVTADDYSTCAIEIDGSGINSHFITGNAVSTATGRISYLLGLQGPCMAVDTACSSSLVAVDLAVQSLRQRSSDLALAGGVNLILNHLGFVALCKIRALSPDGRCRTFDAGANGYGRGEGCGVVLLKRLSDAERDGDPVLAVIRGSAVNQDGHTNGLTAPNGLAQERVIESALVDSGITASEVGYVEGHGTGTPLGDPIELESLSRVYRGAGSIKTPLYVGSIKSNTGHLESSAGIAGLIKTVLCLMHGRIPPNPHFRNPNPRFGWSGSPIQVPRSVTEWPQARRVAGVSSFGFSGTNAHVVVEAGTYPVAARARNAAGTADGHGDQVLFLSAKSEPALKALASAYAAFLPAADAALSDICYTALAGRDQHAFRLAVVGSTRNEISEKLNGFIDGRLMPGTATGKNVHIEQPVPADSHRRVLLPTYPFQRKPYWADESRTYRIMVGKEKAEAPSLQVFTGQTGLTGLTGEFAEAGSQEPSLEVLIDALAAITEIGKEEIDPDRNFFELGMDSIMILRLRQFVLERFNAELEVNLFYQQIDTISKLSRYLAEAGEAAPAAKPGAAEASLPGFPADPAAGHAGAPANSGNSPFVPFKNIEVEDRTSLNQRQQEHLRELIQRHNKRTAGSKALTQQYRPRLANNRSVAGFRPGWKEMTYQLVSDRAEGARIWDAGGSEFLDLTMGFGACLFGHKPEFVTRAVAQTLNAGTPLGPMSPFAGKLAEAVCEMTGSDRAAFYNSGTEAVMVSLRLARTVTGRSKIVLFSGSYHGTFDGILAKDEPGQVGLSHPLAPGIPNAMLEDVYILPYGEPASLDFIRSHASELAAVLVEPVQSRRPDFQPTDFLADLRAITRKAGTALIFDEVITGFRCAQGGAQALFAIRADLATYGKVIGGGLPIGLVAGSADFMDSVDGGMWQFGDSSFPSKRATFVAGTFCHHPLAMTAGLAVVDHLRANPSLQEKLNERTASFCRRMNDWFETQSVPIRMVYFSSLFRFVLKGNHELLFSHLLAKGVYVWEGRNCFLSTAHTGADLDFLADAVQASVLELIDGGYIRAGKESTRGGKPLETFRGAPEIPATPAQRAIWLAQKLESESDSFNLSETFLIRGELDPTVFGKAVRTAVLRHESLRTAIVEREGQPYQVVPAQTGFELTQADWSRLDRNEIENRLDREIRAPFRMDAPPLIRALLFSLGDGKCGFTVTVHHVVCDGWSMDILFEDILYCYRQEISSVPALAPLPFQYSGFSEWQSKFLSSDEGRRVKLYWTQKLEGRPRTELAADYPRSAASASVYAEDAVRWSLSEEKKHELARLQGQTGTTLFMVLSALAHVALFKRNRQEDMLVGSPVAGRAFPELDRQVGVYINFLPLRTRIHKDDSFAVFLMRLRQSVLEAYDHQHYPYALLIEEMRLDRAGSRHPLFDIEIALENFHVRHARRSIENLGLEIEPYGQPYSVDRRKFDVEFRFIERPNSVELNLVYDPTLYRQQTMKAVVDDLEALLVSILKDVELSVAELCDLTELRARAAAAEKSRARREENLGRLSGFGKS